MLDDLEIDQRRLDELCREYGISRLDVFGSISRGEADRESDIDVLYELLPGRRLGWEIETLSDRLAEILGRPVDLVSRNGLHEKLRATVFADARPLYAA